ncbi:hypothetical protein ACGFYQ_33910 [Streptomyces sp. NPDC048258]|uniref:hypothetical protein n=1 Tax=Streptomyces sp. NPDC048258 TaxID=3365527 RepID=UPI00371D87A9
MSNAMSNARTRVVARFLLVTSSSMQIGGITMGLCSVSARWLPVGLEGAWITQTKQAAYGSTDGRAKWLSRDVWSMIAEGSGLARVSHCPSVPLRWAGFEIRVPRLNFILTWKTARRAKEELEHLGCSACIGIDRLFGEEAGPGAVHGSGTGSM